MKLFMSITAVLMLTACASRPTFFPNAGRSYEVCTQLEACTLLIHDIVMKNWLALVPKNKKVISRALLEVELNEAATIVNVIVKVSSGNADFDEKALLAARGPSDFRELKGLDPEVFHKTFRKFSFEFVTPT